MLGVHWARNFGSTCAARPMSVIVFSRAYWASTREKVSAFRGCPQQAIRGESALVEDAERIPSEIKLNNCWANMGKRFSKSLGN